MLRFLTILVSAFCVSAGLLSTAALAQATISRPDGLEAVYPRFEMSNLTGVLSEMGIQNQLIGNSDGTVVIRAQTNTGLIFILTPTVCDGSGRASCGGLEMNAMFASSRAQSELLLMMNAFNQQYAFTKSFLRSDGGPVLARYIIADFGIHKGNLYSNFLNFVRITENFHAYLASGAVAVAPQTPEPGILALGKSILHPSAGFAAGQSSFANILQNQQYADEYINHVD